MILGGNLGGNIKKEPPTEPQYLLAPIGNNGFLSSHFSGKPRGSGSGRGHLLSR